MLFRSSGAEKLSVTAAFALGPKHPALALLAEHDLPSEDDSLVLRRTLGADGRSRAFVNDQPVSVGLLRSLGEALIEVHGQFDTHGLLDPTTHLEALDAFRRARKGGTEDKACATAWSSWQAAAQALAAAQATLAAAQAEESTLRHHVTELEALAPFANEEQELTARRALLRHCEAIGKALSEVRGAIAGDTDIETEIGRAHV